jgi:hypothetical protein
VAAEGSSRAGDAAELVVSDLRNPGLSGEEVATMSAGSTESPDGKLPTSPTEPAAGWALPRGVLVRLGTAGAVLTAAGVRSFADIIGPVFLALVLTIAVSPLRRVLTRRGVKRWIAALIALVVVNALLLGLEFVHVVRGPRRDQEIDADRLELCLEGGHGLVQDRVGNPLLGLPAADRADVDG